jgi:hypothetical protein
MGKINARSCSSLKSNHSLCQISGRWHTLLSVAIPVLLLDKFIAKLTGAVEVHCCL